MAIFTILYVVKHVSRPLIKLIKKAQMSINLSYRYRICQICLDDTATFWGKTRQTDLQADGGNFLILK